VHAPVLVARAATSARGVTPRDRRSPGRPEEVLPLVRTRSATCEPIGVTVRVQQAQFLVTDNSTRGGPAGKLPFTPPA